jgi:murein DD-endopeptidase MepM/ murein hydrolase activator NlpD
MDKRKKLISILAGLMALIMLLGLIAGFIPTAHAASSSELKVELDALKEEKAAIDAEIKKIKGQITENNDDMKAMVEQKNLIDQEIFLLYQQEANINGQIATYSLLISDKQEILVDAETNFAELSEKNKARIQAMEEEGDVSYWSVLFEANSFSDLLDRFNMVQEIAAADKRRLEQLDAAAKEVTAAKESLETEKAALEVSKIELAQTQAQLSEKRAEADALLAELVAKGMEYEDLMEESEDEQAQLAKEIANKKDEYDKAKYQEWLATSEPPATRPAAPSGGSGGNTSSSTVGGISWKVPISYTAFTSPYGWRIHPISGTRKFHYGVDLAAPTGRPIYATRSGTVDTATYGSSAGYYVQINHGDGYKSIYMHMTHYIVKPGQHVSQGQVIGYCGSTGGSTGPHLHFGISYQGNYVNPANYIRI